MSIGTIIQQIDNLKEKYLVIILELILTKLELYSVSEMAEKEGKSRNGILQSKRYRKIHIGRTILAVKGVREIELPFN